MSDDATVDAEHLIATVARAFYDDTEIALIDILIRDKYLRDDQDMGNRLSLQPKHIRKTLQYLQSEHIVKAEAVDDLHEGGSQATKFWYIDYNHAVNTIRLRIEMLKQKLEKEELQARSSSIYLCPGYKKKECNGRYTEIEAQQIIDPETGLFLCQECVMRHTANPDPPPLTSYTLQLVDNTTYLKEAMDQKRRLNVQLRTKMIGNMQLRPGIYDLIQTVRTKTIKNQQPLTSNLPSENRMQGIGTERVKGTGRTAGIKSKKLKEQMKQQQQLIQQDQVMAGGHVGPGGDAMGRFGSTDKNEVTSLRNALGQHIAFQIEKGGSARASLLAKGSSSAKKILDAAAIRVGTELDLVSELARRHKRQREIEEQLDEDSKKRKEMQSAKQLVFLRDNIGRSYENEEQRKARMKIIEEERLLDESDEEDFVMVVDSDDEWENMNEDVRRAKFQALYKKEMARCERGINGDAGAAITVSQDEENDYDDTTIAWEDA